MVSAQNSGLPIPDILTTLIETLFRGDVDDAYQRLLIFILAFTIFYAGLQVSPFGAKSTGKSGISITIGLILAAIATLSMPQTLLNTLFGMYSGIFGVILLFGPALAILIFVFKNFRGQDAGTYIAQGLILAIVGLMLMSKEVLANVPILETIGAIGYVEFTGMIILIVAIVYLGKAIGALRSGSSLSGAAGNPFKMRRNVLDDERGLIDKESNLMNRFKRDFDKEGRLEQQERTAVGKIKNDLQGMAREIKRIGNKPTSDLTSQDYQTYITFFRRAEQDFKTLRQIQQEVIAEEELLSTEMTEFEDLIQGFINIEDQKAKDSEIDSQEETEALQNKKELEVILKELKEGDKLLTRKSHYSGGYSEETSIPKINKHLGLFNKTKDIHYLNECKSTIGLVIEWTAKLEEKINQDITNYNKVRQLFIDINNRLTKFNQSINKEYVETEKKIVESEAEDNTTEELTDN